MHVTLVRGVMGGGCEGSAPAAAPSTNRIKLWCAMFMTVSSGSFPCFERWRENMNSQSTGLQQEPTTTTLRHLVTNAPSIAKLRREEFMELRFYVERDL